MKLIQGVNLVRHLEWKPDCVRFGSQAISAPTYANVWVHKAGYANNVAKGSSLVGFLCADVWYRGIAANED